jgi:RNA polymerase-binding protein DksA
MAEKRTAPKKIRARLERERDAEIRRFRGLGGPAALDPSPSPLAANVTADEVDRIQANESRELGFMNRERLAQRINRLTAALERLENGEYGVCVECSETIKDARLRAMPEVERCVPCQEEVERLERLSHRNGSVWGQWAA